MGEGQSKVGGSIEEQANYFKTQRSTKHGFKQKLKTKTAKKLDIVEQDPIENRLLYDSEVHATCPLTNEKRRELILQKSKLIESGGLKISADVPISLFQSSTTIPSNSTEIPKIIKNIKNGK